MKYLVSLNELFSNDVFDLAKDCMVDLIDKDFSITKRIDMNSRCIIISKNYFYWEDVEEDIIKFINIFEKVNSISIIYEIDISNGDDDFYEMDAKVITVADILEYNVERILDEIDDEVNSDDIHLLHVKIYY